MPTPTDPADDVGSLLAERGAVSRALLAWFDVAGRDLPFRRTTDPWAILVSEAMAQQTQASRAGTAWQAFMAAYPTPWSLAVAAPGDVLRAWRGLGYNRRALNLQRAAVMIVEHHDGRVPADPAALEALPGVGPYTARAVAAIAFGRPVGAVDTNVRRVMSRLLDAEVPRAGVPASTLQALADGLVDRDQPAAWTHALMDVGATICRPRRAECDRCPLRPWCGTAGAASVTAPVTAALSTPEPRPAVSYPSTRRWLRGRIIERLRDVPTGSWVAVPARLGEHGEDQVRDALARLARDGLVEIHPKHERTARLPIRPVGPPPGGPGDRLSVR